MVDSSRKVDHHSHTPVLFQEVLSALNPRPGSQIIDATVGGAGHAVAILEATAPDGLLLGIDRDLEAVKLARAKLSGYGQRATIRHGSYAEIRFHASKVGWTDVQGVLMDLGMSSMQLNSAQRGFSFRQDGPLDMRFDRSQETTAGDLVNHLNPRELAEIIRRYGEEPQANKISRAIVNARPIGGTGELAAVLERTLGRRKTKINPATRTFQALRIAVNDELEVLRQGLRQAVTVLVPGGRLVVIAFHSLEDRIVKRFFREKSALSSELQLQDSPMAEPELSLITRKPIRPTNEEIEANPRARSARLRVAEKTNLA